MHVQYTIGRVYRIQLGKIDYSVIYDRPCVRSGFVCTNWPYYANILCSYAELNTNALCNNRQEQYIFTLLSFLEMVEHFFVCLISCAHFISIYMQAKCILVWRNGLDETNIVSYIIIDNFWNSIRLIIHSVHEKFSFWCFMNTKKKKRSRFISLSRDWRWILISICLSFSFFIEDEFIIIQMWA